MATVTRILETRVDDLSGLAATCSFDYDDQAMRITAFRVENPTQRAISATLIKQSNGRIYNQTFPAGQTTFISIPQNPPTDRIGLTLDVQGRPVGYDFTAAWVL